jgi:hypothetical protein
MTGRRTAICISLFSALLFCAFAAQGASAIVPTKSNNTTAFTCVKDASKAGDFKDAHCDVTGTPGAEEYKHELISLDTTTEIAVTNEKVTNETKSKEPLIFKINTPEKVELECATVKNNAKTSNVHNVEPGKGQHTFTGEVVMEWSECTVKQPKNCAVTEPVVANAAVHGVEGMEGPKGEKNAMGLEFVGAGPEETFVEFEFKNGAGGFCSLKGPKIPIKGRVVATSGPTTESAQANKESGATLAFTPKFKMQTLKLGGFSADFQALLTSTMAGGGNPISLTTTT